MQTITVPLGQNCSLDGGPFAASRAIPDETPDDDGNFVLENDEGNIQIVEASYIEDVIGEEMNRNEPVSVNTGDVGDGYTVATIDLPLVDGFTVRIHDFPGQGKDVEANLGNLRGDQNRRRHFERELAIHGGAVS